MPLDRSNAIELRAKGTKAIGERGAFGGGNGCHMAEGSIKPVVRSEDQVFQVAGRGGQFKTTILPLTWAVGDLDFVPLTGLKVQIHGFNVLFPVGLAASTS